MKIPHSSPRPVRQDVLPDRRLLRWVRHAAFAGLALVLVWPSARGYSQWIGWLPMWLLGMPMAAWWSLYRFRLPAALYRGRCPRRRGAQARRLRKPARSSRVQVA